MLNFLFIGRLEKETGVAMYLKALRLLKKDGKNFSLIVCGDGPLRKEAEKYIKDNKLKVELIGEIRETRTIRDYLKQAEFVFASGYLSILEAMASKKLVFSVFGNPLKEDYLKLSKLGKFIVICGNEKELVEKIKFYLKNPKKEKEMTEAAYNWVRGETWEKMADIYLKLWRDKFSLGAGFGTNIK